MPRFKVSSGDYVVVVTESTPRKAGDMAIRIHNDAHHSSKLGQLTMVQEIKSRSKLGDPVFLFTPSLIDDNTTGIGDGDGQYSEGQRND